MEIGTIPDFRILSEGQIKERRCHNPLRVVYGRILCESVPGKWTKFTAAFPAKAE